MKTEEVCCSSCGASILCEVIRDEYGDDVDCPDNCPDCGESLIDGEEPSRPEDFCRGT